MSTAAALERGAVRLDRIDIEKEESAGTDCRKIVVAGLALVCGCAATAPTELTVARDPAASPASEQEARLATERRWSERGYIVPALDPAVIHERPRHLVYARPDEPTAAQQIAEQVAVYEAERRLSDQDRAVLEWVLRPEAAGQLDRLAATLTATPDRLVVVEGHTDSRGSVAHNLELSRRRADTVRSYLISQGCAAGNLMASGIGDQRPVGDNRTSTHTNSPGGRGSGTPVSRRPCVARRARAGRRRLCTQKPNPSTNIVVNPFSLNPFRA